MTTSKEREALADLVAIDDPAFYLNDPFPVFARLRKEAPAFFVERLNTHVVTRYADVRDLSKSPETWSVTGGIQLKDAVHGSAVEHRFFPEGAELISTIDPPRHSDIRRVIAPSFTPRRVAELEDEIRFLCRKLLDEVEDGAELDFVDRIANVLPMWTVAKFMGLPVKDVDSLRFWSDEMMKVGSVAGPEELTAAAGHMADMNEYFLSTLQEKRHDLSDDFLSVLAGVEIDARKLTDLNILMLGLTVLVAGNGTTRNLLSGLMEMLALHPDQRALLAEDTSLAAGAVDETLRVFCPVPGFLRTAVKDTEVGGEAIQAGRHAFIVYMSANHDETVFEDPERFDIRRPSRPGHLAFGFGQHVCPGASFARLECRVFMEELIARFPTWSISSDPVRRPTVMENSWLKLPVTFSRAES